jgi:hypothetical protein
MAGIEKVSKGPARPCTNQNNIGKISMFYFGGEELIYS